MMIDWSEDEIIFLKNNYLTMSYEEISKKINRTKKSVSAKIYRLKLPNKIDNMPRKCKLNGKDIRYKLIGCKHRAETRWSLILYRLKNTHIKKNYNYKNIALEMEKEEFVKWFIDNDFEGCSVDRINNKLGYRIDNLQLISLSENIGKDKRKAKNGACVCCVCKIEKPLDLFRKNKRSYNGYATICLSCDRSRYKSKVLRLDK